MSTTVKEPTSKSTKNTDRASSEETDLGSDEPLAADDLSLLEDKMPDSLRWPRVLVSFAVLLGLIFVLANYVPLVHTDLWGHLAYGREIVAERAIPTTEPLMPLAKGVPYVDTAWGSKVGGYLMYEQFGIAGLNFLFATSILLCCVALSLAIYRRGRSMMATITGLAVFLIVGLSQLQIIRPQLGGLVCFMALLVMISEQTYHKRHWWMVPVLFAVWSNLHGSWPVGLVVMGAALVGQMIDINRRTKSWTAFLRAGSVWRRLFLLELAAAAVLLNPTGIGVYADVLTIAQDTNMQAIDEWRSLSLKMFQGQAAFVASLLLLLAYRISPRRVSATEFLLIAGLGAASLWSARMIMWWAPVIGLYLGLHLTAILRQWRHAPVFADPSPRSGMWSVVVIGLAWIFFAVTPFKSALLHGQKLYLPGDERTGDVFRKGDDHGEPAEVATFRKRVDSLTPIDAFAYLKKNAEKLPGGLMYNAYEWGDYFTFAGSLKQQLFVNSHAHLVPTEVWNDILVIGSGSNGWDDKLDRYSVNLVVVEPNRYVGLVQQLEASDTWEKRFEDPHGVSVIYVRRVPMAKTESH